MNATLFPTQDPALTISKPPQIFLPACSQIVLRQQRVWRPIWAQCRCSSVLCHHRAAWIWWDELWYDRVAQIQFLTVSSSQWKVCLHPRCPTTSLCGYSQESGNISALEIYTLSIQALYLKNRLITALPSEPELFIQLLSSIYIYMISEYWFYFFVDLLGFVVLVFCLFILFFLPVISKIKKIIIIKYKNTDLHTSVFRP